MEKILSISLLRMRMIWLQEGDGTKEHQVPHQGESRGSLILLHMFIQRRGKVLFVRDESPQNLHPHLLLLRHLHHHPMMKQVMTLRRSQEEEDIGEATQHGRSHTSSKSTKKVGRASPSSPMMELLEHLTKC